MVTKNYRFADVAFTLQMQYIWRSSAEVMKWKSRGY